MPDRIRKDGDDVFIVGGLRHTSYFRGCIMAKKITLAKGTDETVTISLAEYNEMQKELVAVDVVKPQIRFLANCISALDEGEPEALQGLSQILWNIHDQLKGQDNPETETRQDKGPDKKTNGGQAALIEAIRRVERLLAPYGVQVPDNGKPVIERAYELVNLGDRVIEQDTGNVDLVLRDEIDELRAQVILSL